MEKRKAILLVFSTALISGVSIFLNKYAVSGVDADIFTFSKNLVVAMLLLSILFLSKGVSQLKDISKKTWSKLIAIGLIGGSIPFILFFNGLKMTTGASASLIHKTMFLFVAALAVIFLKEKLNKKFITASILLVAGNYLMLKPSWSIDTGDLMILAATLFWAAENVLSKHVLKETPANIVAFSRMFFGSSFILAYLIATGKSAGILALGASQIIWVLFTAAFLLLYQLTWYNGLKHVDVSLATAILLLGSPITTLLNFFSGAAISLMQVSGSALILLGIMAFMNATERVRIGDVLRPWDTKE